MDITATDKAIPLTMLRVPSAVKESQLAALEKLTKALSKESSASDAAAADAHVMIDIPESLACGVCRELIVKPTECFPCRHSFCESCLKSVANASGRFRSRCPVCRRNIHYARFNQDMENQINTKGSETCLIYEQRLTSLSKDEKVNTMPLPGLPALHSLHRILPGKVADFIGRVLFNPAAGECHFMDFLYHQVCRAVNWANLMVCLFIVPLLYLTYAFMHLAMLSGGNAAQKINTAQLLTAAAEETSSASSNGSFNGIFNASLTDDDDYLDMVADITANETILTDELNTTKIVEGMPKQSPGNPRQTVDYDLSLFPVRVLLDLCFMFGVCCLTRCIFSVLHAFDSRKTLWVIVFVSFIVSYSRAYYQCMTEINLFFQHFPFPDPLGYFVAIILWCIMVFWASLLSFWQRIDRQCRVHCIVLAISLYSLFWCVIAIADYAKSGRILTSDQFKPFVFIDTNAFRQLNESVF